MLRTIFSIGLFAVLGLIALKFIFGIFGFAVGLFVWLLFAALKIGLVGLVIYFIIRIVSPDTARATARAVVGSLAIRREVAGLSEPSGHSLVGRNA